MPSCAFMLKYEKLSLKNHQISSLSVSLLVCLLLQRVDTEDMGEVMLAELTLDPLVKATKAAYEDVKERTGRLVFC